MRLSEVEFRPQPSKGKRKVYKTEFSSINSLIKSYDNGIFNNRSFFRRSSERSESDNFFGTNSFKEALGLLQNGWTQGSISLTKELKLANAKKQDVEVKRAIFDIVGFQASVPRYLQGIPTNMVNQRVTKQKQKIINLVKSINYSSGVSKDRILEDSVKFLQILQSIEKQGIRANVFVVFHSAQYGGIREDILIRTKVKSSSERLNISKMSFPLMHPSFLRRMIFKVMENEQRVNNPLWGRGYGVPQQAIATKMLLDESEYYIPTLISNEEAQNIMSNIT